MAGLGKCVTRVYLPVSDLATCFNFIIEASLITTSKLAIATYAMRERFATIDRLEEKIGGQSLLNVSF